MKPIVVEFGDICEGETDLAVLPCSAKCKEVEGKSTQARIEQFDLPAPFKFKGILEFGGISPLFLSPKVGTKVRNFTFAASVNNKSDPSIIESIGAHLGNLTKINNTIRNIECPFLGAGHGGLLPHEIIPALYRGFIPNRHPSAFLTLKNRDTVSVIIAQKILEILYEQDRKAKRGVANLMQGIRDRDDYDFDFALGFAGEDRLYACALAEYLKALGARVFYDDDFKARLAGSNIGDELHNIYSRASIYYVPLVSEHFNKKQWPNLERMAAQERALEEIDANYIIPISFPGQRLKGISNVIGHLNSEEGPMKNAEILMEKLNGR